MSTQNPLMQTGQREDLPQNVDPRAAVSGALGNLLSWATTPLAKVNTEDYTNTRLQRQGLDPNQVPKQVKQTYGAVTDLAQGLTSPLNIGLASTGSWVPSLARYAALGFAPQMISSGTQNLKEGNYPAAALNLALGATASLPGMHDLSKIQGGEEGFFRINPDQLQLSPSDAVREQLASNPVKNPAARANRLLNRKPGIGDAHNQSQILSNSTAGDWVPVGEPGPYFAPDTMDFIMARAKGNASRVLEDASFYERFRDLALRYFGLKDLNPTTLAFGMTQAGVGPVEGMGDVLKAERIAAGLPESSASGDADPMHSANAQQIIDIYHGKVPQSGIGQKIGDFIPNLEGVKTRPVIGDDPALGMPTAGDRHDFRAGGYVDPAYRAVLRDKFGDQAANIKLDTPENTEKRDYSGAVSEPQYEKLVAQNNQLAQAFNDAQFLGKTDWEPQQVQAARWAAMRDFQGFRRTMADDVFTSHFSTMPFEASWGSGSPYDIHMPPLSELPAALGRKFTDDFTSYALDQIAAQRGVRIISQAPITGVWGGNVNPAMEFGLLGTPQAKGEVLRAALYGANQTSGFLYHMAAEGEPGNAGAIDITSPDRRFGNRAFVKRFVDDLQNSHPVFGGASIRDAGGKPGIRILNINPDTCAPLGDWDQQSLSDIQQALESVSAQHKIKTEFGTGQAALEDSSTNDWKAVPNGMGHLQGLSGEGSNDFANYLAGPYRAQLTDYVRDWFKANAPDVWARHFPDDTGQSGQSGKPGKPGSGSGSAGSAASQSKTSVPAQIAGNANAGAEGGNVTTPYTASQLLGSKVKADNFSHGWITSEGSLLDIGGYSHEQSIANAARVKYNNAVSRYPQLSAANGLVRGNVRYDVVGAHPVFEIFYDPTDAQLMAMRAVEKATGSKVDWWLTDPTTGTVVTGDKGVNTIRRTLDGLKSRVPF